MICCLFVLQEEFGMGTIPALPCFAEDLLLNTAGAWQKCSLEQKQRLQQVLFPRGVEYTDGVYRTQETSFLFTGLGAAEAENEGFGSATGNRTRVSTLRGSRPNP